MKKGRFPSPLRGPDVHNTSGDLAEAETFCSKKIPLGPAWRSHVGLFPPSCSNSAPAERGFTLLEVLVAIAILGLSLTAILSAQTGIFASSERIENMSLAVGLARCRMNELELKLVRDGYPLIDEQEEGPCCNDEASKEFTCSWKVNRVELPPPPTLSDTATGESGAEGAPGSLGSLGALMAVEQSKGEILGKPGEAKLGDIADLMGSDALSGGTQGMAPLVMSLVYPQLKPMLEASIRKVSVAVHWKQGSVDKELAVTQFVTSPQQGGFDPLAAQGLEAAAEALEGSPLGGPAAPTSGAEAKEPKR